jgi:ribosome recycling factor
MSLHLLLRNARIAATNSALRSSVSVLRSSASLKALSRQPQRGYASKNKVKATSTIVPGSKQPITDAAAQQEYDKAETAMKTSVDWFRKECAASETRAAGRVTPALLAPVRVKLPDNPKTMKLEELATVGVREGSTLLITLFDEHVRFLHTPSDVCSPLLLVDRETRRSCSLCFRNPRCRPPPTRCTDN